MSPVYSAKLREIQSVYNELKQLMKPEEIGPWLLTEGKNLEAVRWLTSSARAGLAGSGRRCLHPVRDAEPIWIH